MKIMQRILVVMMIILIISIIVVIVILKGKIKETDFNNNSVFEQDTSGYEIQTKLSKITNANLYFAVEKIFNSYFSYIEELNGDKMIMFQVESEEVLQNIKQQQQQEGIKVLNDMISKESSFSEYLTQSKLIQEGKRYTSYSPRITDISYVEKAVGINVYIIEAKLDGKDIKLGIKVDSENMTFEILPEGIIENKTNDEIINLVSEKAIQENENNKFKYNSITNEYIVKRYFNDYITLVQEDVKSAYERLDSEYAKKRFGSFENYQSYINSNIEKIKNLTLSKYQIGKYGDNKQYVCIDSANNYYIFRETSILKYSLLLDTYTVDLPEYTEKYNSSNEQNKVAFCIDKFTRCYKRWKL